MKFLIIFLLSISCYASSYLLLTGEWDPYTGVELKSYGIANEVITKALSAVGEKVEYKFVPWPRNLDFVKNNSKYMGSSVWAYTEERAKIYSFSDYFVNNRESFFYIKNREKEISWNELTDLKKIKASFGATRSYEHVEVLKRAGLKVDIANSDILNFKKLIAGRIQYFPCNKIVADEIIRKHFPDHVDIITHTKQLVLDQPLGIIVNKQNQEAIAFIKKFNKGLKIIRKNGELKKTIEDYFKQKDISTYIAPKSASTETIKSSPYP